MAYVASAHPSGEQSVPRDEAAAGAAATGANAAAEDSRIAWIMARLRGTEKDDHRALLILRFALINLFGFALLSVAHVHGLLSLIWASDKTYLSVGISVVFLGGLVFCGYRIWQTSRDLDALRSFDPLAKSRAADYLALLRGANGDGRAMIASAMRLKLTQRISVIRHVANSLVLLGLIGTVIGFIIALSGVDPNQAGNVKSIAPMVSTMIEGMSTALFTTLVGAVLNLWLLANYQLLASGTVKLITGLVEFGELNAGT